MTANRIYRLVVGVVAIVLFAVSLRMLTVEQILDSAARVGWGFGVILLIAGARDAVRALAWTRTVDADAPLAWLTAFKARLAGEALNSLLPMGMVVGEPAKASYVADRIPFRSALTALALEFAFYTASLVLLFAAGFLALASMRGIQVTLPATVVASVAVLAIAAAVVVRTPWLASIRRRDIATIGGCEIAYQLLGIVEVYFILRLISPAPPTIASAVVLETVGRAVTMVFKIVPLRLGIDEASSSFAAGALALAPATGVTLALIRKLRTLFWSGLGLLLFVRRPARQQIPGPARFRRILAASAILACAVAGVSAQEPTGTVTGAVSVAAPNGAPVVLPGVTVTLTCAGDPKTAVSGGQGEFQFSSVPAGAGTCSIAADLEGFKSAASVVAIKPGETTNIELLLGLDTLREEVTVRAAPASAVDRVAPVVDQIGTAMLQTAPTANERFQEALPLIPGVVRGPDGLLSVKGSRSNQTALTLNSANGTDPVTGEDAIELPIVAVRAVQVRGAAYAPEFGLSAGAATTVETERAGDTWDVTVNDLEPRLRRRGGEFRGIESWTPRVTIGGPVVKRKLNLLESIQYEYSQTRVFGLPPFESDTKLESFQTFTRGDWAVTGTNHLTLTAMVSPRKTTFAGLNTFNPQSVTSDVSNHNILGSAADQFVVGDNGLVETRFSVKQFDSTIAPSQGRGPMVLAPDVNSGSYFNDQDRTSRRAEWFTTYSVTPFGPSHLVKAGAGVTYETFGGTSTSRPVRIVREDGTPSEIVAFAGSGALDKNRTLVQGYAQDSWAVAPRLTLQYGARYDYDTITGDVAVAPRGTLTVLATADGRTVVRGGAGVFYNAVPLNVASFTQLQTRVVTTFVDDAAAAPTGLPNVVASPLRTPRSANWSVEVDREWIDNLFVRVGYQQRESRREAIVDGTPDAIVLRTDGRSRYREAQISGRYVFRTADQIVASYTRSEAVGDLNDFNGFFGNVENPVIRRNESGPLPWDASNRMLLWGSISLPRGFAIFPVLDVRTGFPVSNVDADRQFVGPRNAVGRYPRFVSLDAQLTKRLRVFGHNATIGLKVFNITDHFNPRDYQGNLASPRFGDFDNSVGRTFRGKWVFEL